MCVYPCLSNRDYGFFRLGGAGLANCMIVAARAYLVSQKLRCEMLRPTWERLGVGQWIRSERDKRCYRGLFKDESLWKKVRKAWLIRFGKDVVVEVGLKNFFGELIKDRDSITKWLMSQIRPEALNNIPNNLSGSIAMHIRLGDYKPPYSTSVEWYRNILLSLQNKLGHSVNVLLFSDGSDEQLVPILSVEGVRRVFYGNALADIIAISRCNLLIGSDSTFSGWGAYLGQIPSIFPHLHYSNGGSMLEVAEKLKVLDGSDEFPDEFLKYIE